MYALLVDAPRHQLGRIALGAWLLLTVVWLLDITGHSPPPPVSVALTLGALVVGGAFLLDRATRADRLLVALVVLALAVRWIGVDHEVAERYYLDEGIYPKHVNEINSGELFSRNLIYPHLLFYIEAFAAWIAERGPGVVLAGIERIWGIDDWAVAMRLLFRLIVATFGALTVIPVFHIGRMLGGRAAAALGAALILFSPIYNEGAKLNTIDVPSAFFATLCLMYVARLTERESTSDYLKAGVASGLAAAAKYPAGMVAIAIVAVWLTWRVASRRFSWGLFAAGAASIATFVLAMPAILFDTASAITHPQGALGGFRLYARGGWVGVVKESNTEYYLDMVSSGLGLVAVGLGVAGLFALERATRRRVLLLLPYPALFLGTLISMRIAVKRNVYPLLPILAALLAVAALAFARRVRSYRRRRLVTAAIATAVLAQPVVTTVRQDHAYTRSGTRQLATEWIHARVPPGAVVLRESYGPRVSSSYALWTKRFAPRFEFDRVQAEVDYLVLSSQAYNRWLGADVTGRAHFAEHRAWYERAFTTFELAASWRPGPDRIGPEIRVYKVEPAHVEHETSAAWTAATIYVPGRARQRKRDGAVRFRKPTDWSMVTARLAAGRYRFELEGDLHPPATLRVRDDRNRPVAELELDLTVATVAEVTLPADGKYYLYLKLGRPSRLRRVALIRPDAASPD